VIPCFTLFALSLQIASERERIDLEWQAERKEAKAAHLKALAEYEEDREREEVSGEADPRPCSACAAGCCRAVMRVATGRGRNVSEN
jgi:hypothetical protein